jgi:hypothetical protein
MSQTLDQIMEDASRRLVEMDYLASETLCLEGLRRARADRDWVAYGRVLMPLQECRRQRRMIAAEASVQLGTAEGITESLESLPAGCVVVTFPLSMGDASRLAEQAASRRRHVEVLWCRDADDDLWTLETFDGAQISCRMPAPAEDLRNRSITAEQPDPLRRAGHWFIAASEALGDAALAAVEAPLGTLDRVEQLERMVQAVGDHEILHQRLGDAARALAGEPAA